FALSSYRRRKKQPWKGLQLSTRIVLYTSLFLILAGSVVFYFLEYDKSMSNETSFAKVFHSVFQSVSSRTAGFSTVNFSLVTQPTLLFFIILMFIGASPGSTGGGIKTTTFYLLFKLSIATIIGKKHIESGRNSIPFSLIDKATTVFLFAITLIFVSTFLLSITEEGISFIDLLFEEVSAFATCGLSTGITSSLSPAGRIIIIVSMFVGRIGPLTLGIALSRKVMTNKYRYPNANIMVG
ncbi:MAG: potassium transporter TrkG, partial [Bacteroidales bacterium]|nr:potassium transporter TrkG [Bacteroidales bacterium]